MTREVDKGKKHIKVKNACNCYLLKMVQHFCFVLAPQKKPQVIIETKNAKSKATKVIKVKHRLSRYPY